MCLLWGNIQINVRADVIPGQVGVWMWEEERGVVLAIARFEFVSHFLSQPQPVYNDADKMSTNGLRGRGQKQKIWKIWMPAHINLTIHWWFTMSVLQACQSIDFRCCVFCDLSIIEWARMAGRLGLSRLYELGTGWTCCWRWRLFMCLREYI